LADLHERLKRLEQRRSTVLNELEIWESGRMEPTAIEEALREFSSVWGELTSSEQAKILHTLLEKVEFDGHDGTVSVSFRSRGLKLLCRQTP
jgi:site-specific DNA recombinase